LTHNLSKLKEKKKTIEQGHINNIEG